jgi:hypothetical protein
LPLFSALFAIEWCHMLLRFFIIFDATLFRFCLRHPHVPAE